MSAQARAAAGGFDRIPGRRDRPAGGDPEGRAALFSVPSGPARERPLSGFPGLTVTCTRCHEVSATSPAGILGALLPFTVVLPWRPNWFLGTCPACRHRAWLALSLRW